MRAILGLTLLPPPHSRFSRTKFCFCCCLHTGGPEPRKPRLLGARPWVWAVLVSPDCWPPGPLALEHPLLYPVCPAPRPPKRPPHSHRRGSHLPFSSCSPDRHPLPQCQLLSIPRCPQDISLPQTLPAFLISPTEMGLCLERARSCRWMSKMTCPQARGIIRGRQGWLGPQTLPRPQVPNSCGSGGSWEGPQGSPFRKGAGSGRPGHQGPGSPNLLNLDTLFLSVLCDFI